MPTQLQHYVPRFILRRFRTGAQDAVHAYDKRSGRSFLASTGKVGAEKGIYDFAFDAEEFTLEPGLAEMEGKAAEHVDRILKGECLQPLNPFERGELARFFAAQLVRTPAHREVWRDLQVRMEAHLRQEGMGDDFFAVDPQVGSRENENRVLMARTLMNAPQNFAPALLEKDWLLMKTDPVNAFLIGDHPLVMHNGRDFGLRGNLGLAVEGIEIYFPLSPTLTLGMMCSSHGRDFRQALPRLAQSKSDDPRIQKGLAIARAFTRAVETGEPAAVLPENVEFLNSLQVARAERFLFSSSAHFALVEKMVADHPEVRGGVRMEEATGKF